MKSKLTNIPSLREEWTVDLDATDKDLIEFRKIFRGLSYIFIEFYAIKWIYNSMITQKKAHIQHIQTLKDAIKNPEDFVCLKK